MSGAMVNNHTCSGNSALHGRLTGTWGTSQIFLKLAGLADSGMERYSNTRLRSLQFTIDQVKMHVSKNHQMNC